MTLRGRVLGEKTKAQRLSSSSMVLSRRWRGLGPLPFSTALQSLLFLIIQFFWDEASVYQGHKMFDRIQWSFLGLEFLE